MLLGGMSVIGIYIWASEASFKATPPAVLSQVNPIIYPLHASLIYTRQSSNSCLLMPSFRLLEQFSKLAMAARSVRGCSFTSLTALEGAGTLLKICLLGHSSA
jgi:hypothetical protein